MLREAKSRRVFEYGRFCAGHCKKARAESEGKRKQGRDTEKRDVKLAAHMIFLCAGLLVRFILICIVVSSNSPIFYA